MIRFKRQLNAQFMKKINALKKEGIVDINSLTALIKEWRELQLLTDIREIGEHKVDCFEFADMTLIKAARSKRMLTFELVEAVCMAEIFSHLFKNSASEERLTETIAFHRALIRSIVIKTNTGDDLVMIVFNDFSTFTLVEDGIEIMEPKDICAALANNHPFKDVVRTEAGEAPAATSH